MAKHRDNRSYFSLAGEAMREVLATTPCGVLVKTRQGLVRDLVTINPDLSYAPDSIWEHLTLCFPKHNIGSTLENGDGNTLLLWDKVKHKNQEEARQAFKRYKIGKAASRLAKMDSRSGSALKSA